MQKSPDLRDFAGKFKKSCVLLENMVEFHGVKNIETEVKANAKY